jgi:bacillithiol biosynthesis cysteine-adding enzyme BshC
MAPEELDILIEEVTRQLGTGPFAVEITQLLKEAYLGHPDIQSATLFLVNALFGRFGLLVLIADTPGFKRAILPILREELYRQTSFAIVSETIARLSQNYHPQAMPREINLFYLEDQLRERIVKEGEVWRVLHTPKTFTAAQLEQELQEHPERFSPNVILRGLLQETILPDVAFIGGGGELAYWLELKDLFGHYGIPFPVLMLRNSVLWMDSKSVQRLGKTGLPPRELFRDTETVIADFVKKHTRHDLVLKEEYEKMEKLYAGLEQKAARIDVTLRASVAAERKRSLCSIGKLEHKFLRAEKKEFAWQAELIRNLKSILFPGNALQERVENLLPFYATYGPAFFDALYARLDPLNKGFLIVECC